MRAHITTSHPVVTSLWPSTFREHHVGRMTGEAASLHGKKVLDIVPLGIPLVPLIAFKLRLYSQMIENNVSHIYRLDP